MEHPLEFLPVRGHPGGAQAVDVAPDGVAEHLVAAPRDAGRGEPAQVGVRGDTGLLVTSKPCR